MTPSVLISFQRDRVDGVKTYINVHKRRRLGKSHAHGKELRVTTSLRLKLKAPRTIRVVHGTDIPLDTVSANFVDCVERRNVRLVGFVGNSDCDIFERVATRKFVFNRDVEHIPRLLDPNAERDGRVRHVIRSRREFPLHDADAHV
jgi:hypothetical protein